VLQQHQFFDLPIRFPLQIKVLDCSNPLSHLTMMNPRICIDKQ
jgi:hypothetical protein